MLLAIDAADDIADGRWGDAAASAASGVGGYLLLTGTLAPVGAVLVAGALVYEHRDWIAERVTSLARSARDGIGAVIERTRERVGAAADGARAALDEALDEAADWAADKVGGAVQDIGDAFGRVGRLIGP